MPGSDVNARTVEVAIESSAHSALTNLEKLAAQLDSLGRKIDDVVKRAKGLSTIGKIDTSGLKNFTNAVNRMNRDAQKASKSAQEVSEASANIGSQSTAIMRTANAYAALGKEMASVVSAKGNSGRTMGDYQKALTTTAIVPASQNSVWTKVFQQMSQETRQLEDESKIIDVEWEDITDSVKEASQAAKEFSKATEDYDPGWKHRTGDVKSGFSREEMERRRASGEYRNAGDAIAADKEQARQAQLYKDIANSYREAEQYSKEAEESWKKVEEYNRRISEAVSRAWSDELATQFAERIKRMRDASKMLQAKLQSEANTREDARQRNLADATAQLATQQRIATRAANSFATALRGVAGAALNIAKRIPSVISGIVRLGKGLAHPISSFKQLLGLNKRSGGGLLGGLLGNRSLAKYIGLIALRRAVTGAIRAIVSGIKEGFENIRNYSSAINSEMNSIENSLLYVKNAWAAAFAPIVSVVRPYINYLLDAIASALNALGRLVAMLTGKGFTVQAVKLSDAMYEAGKAGNSAASGTGKAAKAAEEYKKTIMGFDQLHVLNPMDESSSGSGGSGGGGGGGNSGINVSEMFTTVSLAGQLKDAIDAEDWRNVGRLLAEKINEAFANLDEMISWENVGDKITEKVTALTTTLNSLQYNINWEQIGRTFGSGINTLVNTWNLFFDKFDFVSLGQNIATAINGLFDRVDWGELGRAVTQKFKALWDTIYGFVTTLDWANIGTSIGEFINGALKNINLGRVASAISTGLNGIATTISEFGKTVDWDAVSSEISDFFGTIFEEWDVANFITQIGTIAADIIGALADAAEKDKDKWKEFGTKIGEGLKALPWEEILTDVAHIIIDTLGSLLAGLAIELMPEGMRKRWEELGWIETPSESTTTQQPSGGSTVYQGHGGSGGTFEIPGTIVITEARDDIPATAKVTNNWTGKLGKAVDDISKNDKTTGGWTAQFKYRNYNWWSSNPADWTVSGWTAQFKYKNTKWWSNKNSDWTTGGWTAQYKYKTTKWWSNKNSDWTTGGWTARYNYVDTSKLTKDQKTIAVTAKVTNVTGAVGNAIFGKADGGVFSGGSWKPITRYASGGNPQTAEIFMARESGPELVGRIGSKTAVMNNNQIVSSVAAGVRQAVAEGMAMSRGGQGSMPYEINITVKTQDDEVLARAVERGNAKRKYRLGTATA